MMTAEPIFGGRLHHAGADGELLASRRHQIFASRDQGRTWRLVTSLPLPRLSYYQTVLPPVARLLRAQVHQVVPLGSRLVIFSKTGLFVYDREERRYLAEGKQVLRNKPLNVCASSQGVLYAGEYFGNPERRPVKIMASRDGVDWRAAFVLPRVRHVHGIWEDPFTGEILATTGDRDHEAGIWRLDPPSGGVELLAGGSQMHRAVTLLFHPDYIVYGTDSEDSRNHICLLRRDDLSLQKVQPVQGTVFWGAQAGGQAYFSTVVEPSPVNRSRFCHLWCSRDMIQWREVLRMPKDPWPMKLFQYGQIAFPFGRGGGDQLFFSTVALHGGGQAYRLPLEPGRPRA